VRIQEFKVFNFWIEASELILALLDCETAEARTKANTDKRYKPLLAFLEAEIYPLLNHIVLENANPNKGNKSKGFASISTK